MKQKNKFAIDGTPVRTGTNTSMTYASPSAGVGDATSGSANAPGKEDGFSARTLENDHLEYNALTDRSMNLCSATECTGLIPALPEDEAELESYAELYHFLPRASAKSDPL